MIVIHWLNVVLDYQFNQYGIIPRTIDSLWHIFTAPFIHSDWQHLFKNMPLLLLFSSLCLIRGFWFYFSASVFIFIVGGILLWVFARQGSHIGASGWIFGLWSVSIAMAWYDRRALSIVLGLLVAFFYGGLITGVFPSTQKVSFEAHFFGALAGIIFAALTARIWRRSNVSSSAAYNSHTEKLR